LPHRMHLKIQGAFTPSMEKSFQKFTALFLFFAAATLASVTRVNLFPNLHPSQTLTYLMRYQSNKSVKAEGTVAAPMAPTSAQADAHGLLQIEILNVQPAQPPSSKPAVHARAKFLTLGSGNWPNRPEEKKSEGNSPMTASQDKTVEFTITSNGLAQSVQGLDDLLPDQQQAWQEWIARFALAWTFPTGGAKLGEKWKSEEAEPSPAPIAGLTWERESTYVRNEPCHATQLSVSGEAAPSAGPAETCAVVLTTATLKQKSSPEDSTPESFRLHDLHTAGTAKGTNEIITYISLRTGLVMRATESASQSMDVLIALADNSNRVHYNVKATSHSEVLLVTDSPLAHP
jgi:hypothetical protein